MLSLPASAATPPGPTTRPSPSEAPSSHPGTNLLCPFPALADLPTLLSWRNLAISIWHFRALEFLFIFQLKMLVFKRFPLNCPAPKKVITRVLSKDLLMPVKALSQEARNLMSLLL